MRFPFPRFPAEFEIPDAWWIEAGMYGFKPAGLAYRSPTAEMVALDDIEPPFRLLTAPLEWRGLDRARMVSILKGFVADAELPPISLLILPPLGDISAAPFTYRLLEGVHRHYARRGPPPPARDGFVRAAAACVRRALCRVCAVRDFAASLRRSPLDRD
jgi:hypothetical protein